MANSWGRHGNSDRLFSWAPKSLQMVTAAMKLKDACSLEEKLSFNLDSIFKSRDITLPTNISLVNAIVFPVGMHGCENWDHKGSWVPKNWCFWTVVFENTPESPLDCKEIRSVNPKGNEPWIFIGRTDAEASAPILWPPDVKNWLTDKKKIPWCCDRWKTERVDRGWGGWMASPRRWT